MSSLFGNQKLKDELFCVREERNYFQAKYLEQVSELHALKQELAHAKHEIRRLRLELMNTTHCASFISDLSDDEKKSDSHEVETSEEEEIRQNATQLLQWADYRVCSPSRPAKPASETDDDSESDESEIDEGCFEQPGDDKICEKNEDLGEGQVSNLEEVPHDES